MAPKATPENITTLEPNQVMVFGSNLAGRHGKGAALLACEKFGAMPGVGRGPTGQCYALPTKGWRLETLPLEIIGRHVGRFIEFAREYPSKEFLVTAVGCGLAAYTPEQIAPLFLRHEIPPNVSLPARFWALKQNG
jgi:hypothetical protein